jgi:hypothetical protein
MMHLLHKTHREVYKNASQDYLTNIARSGGGVIFDHARNSRHCYPSAVIICTALHRRTRAEK